MDLALGAATAAVSRAGASSLAEMAAMRLPSLLVPLPTAADNHQFFNARIYAHEWRGAAAGTKRFHAGKSRHHSGRTGRGRFRPRQNERRARLWHAPKSAEQIAANILRLSFKTMELPATGENPTVLTRGRTGPQKFPAA